jgi:hypothetical protein
MTVAADFTVTLAGDIRHASGATNYTVLDLHRFLQDLADDAEAAGNDIVDITSTTPSSRSTDNIIDLLGTFNIDDDAAEYFYDGSITQAAGNTVYSGLRVLGATNNNNTQLAIIQDNALYTFTPDANLPFWGDQSAGGYNGITAQGILMRCLIKSRVNGADIDGQKIRVQSRHWGDTFDFFAVQLGTGESVGAIGTTPDAQNDTGQGTVNAYSHVTNTEGYQTIDLSNGGGALPYYSKWTYGADTSADGLKGMWEYIKDVSAHGTVMVDAQDETSYDNAPTSEGTFVGGDGAAGTAHVVADVLTMDCGCLVTVDTIDGNDDVVTFDINNAGCSGDKFPGETIAQASSTGSGDSFTLTLDTDNVTADKTVHGGLNGNLLLGVTHSYAYNNGAAFTEDETVVWGTRFFYDTLVAGPFTPGNYVTIGANGAAGRVLYDDAVDELVVALEDTSISILGDDVVTEFPGPGAGATTTTAAVNTGLITAQDETSYDDSPTSEGVFDGGTSGYAASDVITLSNGATVLVDTVSAGDVTEFTVQTAGSTPVVDTVLTETSNTGAGSGTFTLTPGVDNFIANVATLDNNKSGGTGILLAATGAATGSHYIQLLTGVAPVNLLPLYGITSAASADVNGTVTARTIPKIFLGSYTGSLIGAYGIGVLSTDLTASDTIQELGGTNQTPPNNVTFTVSGLITGEDYVLVGTKAGGNDFNFAQLTLNGTLSTGSETSLVVNEAIPADTPSSGTLRVTLDDGRIRKIAYSAWVTSTFTITDESWSDPEDATAGVGVMISYIDKLATAAQETFTGVYTSPRTLWIRVRDGGGTPIKTFEVSGSLGSAGGSAVASRITDA